MRVELTGKHGRPTGAWFDTDEADCYKEGMGDTPLGPASLHTGCSYAHEELYCTSKGTWVLRTWTDILGHEDEYYRTIKPLWAARWLQLAGIHEIPRDLLQHIKEREV